MRRWTLLLLLLLGPLAAWAQTVPINANVTVSGHMTAQVRDKGGFTYNVKAYGATGDGTTDDRAAIQAAIDASKDTNQLPTDNGGLTTSGIIEMPPGRYKLSAPLHLFSGQTLRGVGPASRLVAAAGFSGTALVLLDATGGYFSHGRVEDLDFEGSTTAALANAPTTRTLNSTFQRLSLNTKYGLILTYYTQACTIADLFAYGPLDTILHLKGNFNMIRNVDKEGGDTGTSTEPYILIEAHGFGSSANSTGNHLEHILIEGVGSANKTLIKLDGTGDTVLHHLWFETTTTDGYALRILNSVGQTMVTGTMNGIHDINKIQVANTRQVYIARLDVDAEDIEWWKRLEVDSTSYVTVGSLQSRYGGSASLLSKLANVRILESYTKLAFTSPSPLSPMAIPVTGTAVNLLSNPSFESSGTGWTITGSPTTAEYVASEVGPGLMAHYAWGSAQAAVTLTQPVTILASWVGKPMLLSALVKVTTTNGYAHPYLSGAGITAGTEYNYLSGGSGWGIVQQVFTPQSAGTLTVGIRAASVADFAVDGVTLTFGTEGLTHVR